MTTPLTPTQAAILSSLEAKYERESNTLRDQINGMANVKGWLPNASYVASVLATAQRVESAGAELSVARRMAAPGWNTDLKTRGN